MSIKPMTKEERKASKDRDRANGLNKCASCGNPCKDTWCAFCLSEE